MRRTRVLALLVCSVAAMALGAVAPAFAEDPAGTDTNKWPLGATAAHPINLFGESLFGDSQIASSLAPESCVSCRTWMVNGMVASESTDHVYFGLKTEPWGGPGGDRESSVIAWGDNPGLPPEGVGGDYLRVIFTAALTGAPAGQSSLNGLEVARFNPNGNFGIGNFFTAPPSGADPMYFPRNRLDVQGSAIIGRAWAGNAVVGQPDSLAVQNRIGINVITPLNTLHVNGSARIFILPTPNQAKLVTADGNNVLGSINFTNANQVLRGDGTFGSAPAGVEPDWNITSFTPDMFSIPSGNVGIASGAGFAAQRPLHVKGLSSVPASQGVARFELDNAGTNPATFTHSAAVQIGTASNEYSGLFVRTGNNSSPGVGHAGVWIENAGSGGLTMFAGDVANDPTPFVIDNQGFVGIQTLVPASPLDVLGSGSPGTNVARVRSAGADRVTKLIVESNDPTLNFPTLAQGAINSGKAPDVSTTGATLQLGFAADEGADRHLNVRMNNTSLLTVRGDTLSVGVNKTNPGNTLHVGGGVRIDTLSPAAATRVCIDGNKDLSSCAPEDLSQIEPWITPTLAAGCEPGISNFAPEYYKDAIGRVHFRGGMCNTGGCSTPFFMPTGYFPGGVGAVFSLPTYSGPGGFNFNNPIAPGAVVQFPNGSNLPVTIYNFPAGQCVFLDVVSFRS